MDRSLYKLSVTATFRSDLDLRRFPFDRETLEVRIQSFIWTRDQMIFVPDPARILPQGRQLEGSESR